VHSLFQDIEALTSLKKETHHRLATPRNVNSFVLWVWATEGPQSGGSLLSGEDGCRSVSLAVLE
jgi:hypothetical protein